MKEIAIRTVRAVVCSIAGIAIGNRTGHIAGCLIAVNALVALSI